MALAANLSSIAKKVFGTQNERELKSIYPSVQKINSFEPSIKKLNDDELKEMTVKFRARLAAGETLDQILPEAYAVVREAAWRVIGQRHYDVQLIGGISLHRGRIAEMRTGEGKTLVATLACYLNALAGKGVHVITVNDYLARRDAAWMGKIYSFLGLTTGVIVHGLTDSQRKQNYRCDITYGTNNEFGFDYLRDNMKFRLEDYVQRELNFAIVDEVDSILIDEARTPLIISGPTDETTDLYYEIDKQIRVDGGLIPETDYTIDEKSKTAALSEAGVEKMEKRLKIDNLYDPKHIEILHHVNQALRAHVLYHRDTEYVVKEGEVMIVDDFTGRLMPGRRWSDGLHQAIEAKEGVNIENENQTLATITFQNFFRMYNKLSGMTGTADTEATEFRQIYKLDVTIIPTHRLVQRTDFSDVIYKSQLAKFKAIAEEIKVLQAKGQPILVGTVSVEKSELLSNLLKKQGVKHNVLNAKQHEREAEIVAQAGRKGAVTIATNMAGRGTDILLGGNHEFLGKAEVGLLQKDATDEEKLEHEAKLKEAAERWKKTCEGEREEVKAVGGLFILGTERHESRRIDNQLRGRAGRQGDPGTSRFYLSFDDDLLRIFGQSALLKQTVAAMEEDVPIEHRWTTKAIENAQRKVEGHNYDIRKHLLEYDDVMNQQRRIVYAWRKEVLARDHLRDMVMSMVDELAGAISEDFFPGGKPKKVGGSIEINQKELDDALITTFSFQKQLSEKDLSPFSGDGLRNLINKMATEAYQEKETKMGAANMRNIEKMVLLTTIDSLWKDHLLAMDHLREGIGLQGYGQKDPLIAYKKEGFRYFQMMMGQITGDVVRKLFSVQLSADADEIIEEYEEELEEEHSDANISYNVSTDGNLIPAKGGTPTKVVEFEDDLLAARQAPRGPGGMQPRQVDFNELMAERAKQQMLNTQLSHGGGPASSASAPSINGVDLSKVGRTILAHAEVARSSKNAMVPEEEFESLEDFTKKAEATGELPPIPTGLDGTDASATLQVAPPEQINDFESLDQFAKTHPDMIAEEQPEAIEPPSSFPAMPDLNAGFASEPSSVDVGAPLSGLSGLTGLDMPHDSNQESTFGGLPPLGEKSDTGALSAFSHYTGVAPNHDFSDLSAGRTGVIEGIPLEESGSGHFLSLPESPDVSGLMEDPAPEPTLPPPLPQTPASLDHVRTYSEQPRNFANTTASANLPFSVLIEGKLEDEERARLIDIVNREKLGISEMDLEPQFEGQRILIPRISEYAAVVIVSALRTVKGKVRLGLSEVMAPLIATASRSKNSSQRMQDSNPEPIQRTLTTGSGSVDVNPMISSMTGPGGADENIHPAEIMPVTPSEILPGFGPFHVMDAVTATASLRIPHGRAENSVEFRELSERLKTELQFKAYRKGANGIINFSIQIVPLSDPTQFRILAAGSAIRSGTNANYPKALDLPASSRSAVSNSDRRNQTTAPPSKTKNFEPSHAESLPAQPKADRSSTSFNESRTSWTPTVPDASDADFPRPTPLDALTQSAVTEAELGIHEPALYDLGADSALSIAPPGDLPPPLPSAPGLPTLDDQESSLLLDISLEDEKGPK